MEFSQFSSMPHSLYNSSRACSSASPNSSVWTEGEHALGLEHAIDARGGEAEDAEDVGGVVEVAAGGVMLHEAAGEEAEEGDLVFEAFYGCGLEVGELALVEAAGVEAVLEGIGVAGLGAGEGGGFGGAAGFGGGGVGGHGGIIAQMFYVSTHTL